MATTILLVDDHSMFRSGMKALLEQERGFEVVAEAATGDDGVDLVRAHKPDVVIMDLSMPGSDGLEATRRISALGLKTKVLVLTARDGGPLRSLADVAIVIPTDRTDRAQELHLVIQHVICEMVEADA